MKKSTILFALPLVGMMITGCEKNNKNKTPEQEVEASISLNKTSLVLDAGASETLVATTANGQGGVTWSSSNTDAVTVDENGLVKAVATGNSTITATYSGKTATCQVRVKGIQDYYALAGVQENANIKDFKNNVLNTEGEFKGQMVSILEVGDDNPLDVKPVLKILDLNTMEAVPQSNWDFDYEYKLQKHNGEAYVDVTEDYGVFDAENCTFDFNEAAIGGQFKLSVMPGGLTDAQKADPENTKSVELKVFNGYNVYTADELAYFNDINFLSTNRQGSATAGINESWVAFRRAHGLSESYVAPSIFLQKTIEIKRENLPDVIFYTEEEAAGQPDWVGKMKDASDIYCHYSDGFTFNGNYFHIDTTKVPLAIDDPGLGYDDNVSHCTLFKIAFNGSATERTTKEVFLKHCSYFGNAPRGDDENDFSMGLIFFKIQNKQYRNNIVLQATFDQFNVKGACISFFSEYGESKMIVKDSIVSEGYSNGLYLWNNGHVDFQNSELRNFGGPVFITDGSVDDTNVGFKITADEATVFDNWVTGSEPWFTHTKGGGPATAIPMIQRLDEAVQGLSYGLSSGAYTKTFLKGTEKFMNFIIINYGAIPDVTFQKGNGSVIGVDKESATRDAYVGIADGGEFVLNTDSGGAAQVNPGNGNANPLSTNQFGGNYLDVIGKMAGFGYLSLFFEIINVA